MRVLTSLGHKNLILLLGMRSCNEHEKMPKWGIFNASGPVQTSNFLCTEPYGAIKDMRRSTLNQLGSADLYSGPGADLGKMLTDLLENEGASFFGGSGGMFPGNFFKCICQFHSPWMKPCKSADYFAKVNVHVYFRLFCQ